MKRTVKAASWSIGIIAVAFCAACGSSDTTPPDSTGAGGSVVTGGSAGTGGVGVTGGTTGSGGTVGSGGAAGSGGTAGTGGTMGTGGTVGSGGAAGTGGTTGSGGTVGSGGTAGSGGTTGTGGASGAMGSGGAADAGRDASADGSRPDASSALCQDRRGGALITLRNGGGPSATPGCNDPYVVWITNNAFIDEAITRVGKGVGRIPNLVVLSGKDCDPVLVWHPDPQQATFADVTTEVCDGCPNVPVPGGAGRFCPWAGEVVAVDDRR